MQDRMEGRGKYWYFRQTQPTNSILFVGEMKDNCFNGLGKMVLNCGTSYSGSFVNSQLSSQRAVIVFSNGDKYKGPILGGCRNGLGLYSTQSMFFEGNFKDDLREGFGRAKYTSKDAVIEFEGNFTDDRRWGKCDLL